MFGLWLLAAESYAEPSGHAKMLELLREIRDRSSGEHFYLAGSEARELRERFEALRTDGPPLVRWELLLKLGEAEQTLGREQEAIDLFTEAYRILSPLRDDIAPLWINRLLFRLGMAHLRMAETRNCALRHSGEACILPIRGGGIHLDQAPSRLAIRFLTEAVEHAPPRSEAYFSARWLLNIAYMTVGKYPKGVPAELLIPIESFASDELFPRFENVSHHAGLSTFSLAGGAVASDFDMDGHLDLLVSSLDPAGQLRLFINDEDGTFTERTDTANLTGLFGGLNLVQADYDNDGDDDVLVLRGGWMASKGRHPNSLLRNNGDGTFTDVTFETGLGEVHYPTQTASWADYDNDGDLDLYIGNETTPELPEAPSQLFENRGGTFVDVASRAGVTNDRFAKSVIWGDYDADGFPDLYVSNIHGENRLYRNNGNRGNGGDGAFTDVALELAVAGPEVSFPAWFWDFDNDGALDIYVATYDVHIGQLAAFHLGLPYLHEMAHLYRGDGRGGFENVAEEMNLVKPNAPMGANFGDLDGDGYLDFYLGTGFPPYQSLMPNVMYRNQGGERFADITSVGGFGHLQKGHAVVFADFDRDGDMDVFEQLGGFFAGDRFHDALYENPGIEGGWISVTLTGDGSNRSAIGTRIRVRVRENGLERDIYRYVNGGGTFGGNPLERMIGLGAAESIDSLQVYWPRSGKHQVFRDVPMGSRLHVRENWDEVLVVEEVARGGRSR